MQRCTIGGAGKLKVITAIPERPMIEKTLAHLALESQPLP
jgi:hypothetical protein